MKAMTGFLMTSCVVLVIACLPVRAEMPEEWVKLGARVHGGFGSFIPVGIRIGLDAMERLKAQPRELAVVYYSGDGVPCPCSADGVMLAVSASPGQGTLQVAPEKSPAGSFAVVVIRPRRGGDGLRYTVPISWLPRLAEINRSMSNPLDRYHAVMNAADLFTVEPVK